jgi:hypothetical protein
MITDRGKTMALEWIAETLRVSLFSTDKASLTDADWKKITGQEEAETQQKVVGRRTMVGPWLDGVLNVSAVGARVDCVLSPKTLTETVEEGYVPSVGAWPAVCYEFLNRTADWVGNFQPPVVRMAFGAILLARCADRQDAYKTLIGLLKTVQGDPERMRDLIFRVNWPVKSTSVVGLTLNRITHWAVLEIHAIQLVIPTSAQPVIADTPGTFVIRLELDHNTDAGWTDPFDQNRLVPIYNELVQLALENAEKGELT